MRLKNCSINSRNVIEATPRNGEPSQFAPSGEDAKALGAYYTDTQVADFLAWWAIRSPTDTVLDSSFGGGVFLRSACKRLYELGGNPAKQIYGAEIARDVHSRISAK
jgi:hypothetical protein